MLVLLSFWNAIYVFYRTRSYRLFESPVENELQTPSARRIRVDSLPMSSSPLRYVSQLLFQGTAESRSHPDASRDVWEVAVWDPTPVCLQLFCFFSPSHIALYWMFLPIAATDPRPSVTVATAVLISAMLSFQLSLLCRLFSQQAKDSALIHKEVLHEYNSKFVHPNMSKCVREAGTQTPSKTAPSAEVVTSSPFFLINRRFVTRPNKTYATHFDPDSQLKSSVARHRLSRATSNGELRTPVNTATSAYIDTILDPSSDFSSPIRPIPVNDQMFAQKPQPYHRPSIAATGLTGGDGGSLGVYQHASSPLRKSTVTPALRKHDAYPRNPKAVEPTEILSPYRKRPR